MSEPRPEDKVIYRNAVQNTINLIRDLVPPHLPPAERERFLATRFVIEENNNSYSGIVAKPEEQAVYVPLGFIVLSDQLEFAMQINSVKQTSPEPLSAFVRRFVATLRYNLDPLHARLKKKNFPLYQEYAGISDEEIRSITSTSDFQAMHVGAKVSAFTLIFLHEFAHLSGITSESEADDFAIERAHQAGISVFSAIWAFLVYGYIEEAIGSSGARHLPTACRTSNLLRKSIAYHEQDSDFIAHMRSINALDQWRALPSQMEDILMDDNVSCIAGERPRTPVINNGAATEWPKPH